MSNIIYMLSKYSNFNEVKRKFNKYKGNDDVKLYKSTRKDKKYMVIKDNKKIHFGQMGYQDFTKHKDKERRQRYLKRATNIKGNWKKNKYSPNNLSINLLW